MPTQIERAACQMLAENMNWLVLPEAREYAERIVADPEFCEFAGDWYDAAIDQAWNPTDYAVPQSAARLYRGMVEAYAFLAQAVASYRRHGCPLEDVTTTSGPEFSVISSLAGDIARCHALVASAYAQEIPSSASAAP